MLKQLKHFFKFIRTNSSIIFVCVVLLFTISCLFLNYATPIYRNYLGHFISSTNNNINKNPVRIYKSGNKYLIIDTKTKKIYRAKLILKPKSNWHFSILESNIEQKIGSSKGNIQLGNKKILFYNYREPDEKTNTKIPLNFIIYDIETNTIDKNFNSIIKTPLYSFGCVYNIDTDGNFIYVVYDIINKNNIIIKYDARNNTQEKIANKNNIYMCKYAENIKNNIKNLFIVSRPERQIGKIELYYFNSKKNIFETIQSSALQNLLIEKKINYYKLLSLDNNKFLLFGYSHKTKENIISLFEINNNKAIESYTIKPKEDSTFKTILGLKFGLDTSNVISLNNEELLITGGITGRADLTWSRNEAYIYNITNKKLKRIGDMKHKHAGHSTLTIDNKRVLIYEEYCDKCSNMEIFERGGL